jgi:nucleotide-binding universal stress UspA family protein
MYNLVLLAIALQRWERYSTHALAARDVAVSLARSATKPLHVLSVYDYDPVRLPSGAIPADLAARVREQEIERTDALMRQRMDEFLAPVVTNGLDVSTILRVGNPRDVIPDVAEEVQADLLVIGSHSRRGVLDISLGGTAQHVTKRVGCTVVLVSPSKEKEGEVADPLALAVGAVPQ